MLECLLGPALMHLLPLLRLPPTPLIPLPHSRFSLRLNAHDPFTIITITAPLISRLQARPVLNGRCLEKLPY